MRMTMTAAVMRATTAVTRKTKGMLPRKMVITKAIIWRVRRANSESSDPGDEEQGNEGDNEQD